METKPVKLSPAMKEVIQKMREGASDLKNEIYCDCDGSIFQNDTNINISEENFRVLEDNGLIQFEQVVQGRAECYVITTLGQTIEL